MELADSYDAIRGSIVAFIPRMFDAKPDGSAPEIPPIIGTGYILDSDGIVATNDHVVREFARFKAPPGEPADAIPVVAMLFKRIDRGVVELPLEVLGVFRIVEFKPGQIYYGPKKPDIAFVHVKARGLQTVKIDGSTSVREGMEVATAGFPMG